MDSSVRWFYGFLTISLHPRYRIRILILFFHFCRTLASFSIFGEFARIFNDFNFFVDFWISQTSQPFSMNWGEQIRHFKQLSSTLCSILILLLLSTPLHSLGSWLTLQTCITPLFTFNFRSCGLQINYQLLLAAYS
jgi:hypothetical protein